MYVMRTYKVLSVGKNTLLHSDSRSLDKSAKQSKNHILFKIKNRTANQRINQKVHFYQNKT